MEQIAISANTSCEKPDCYNAFHPLLDHSPMRIESLGRKCPSVLHLIRSQARRGFSQASQIHKRDRHIGGQSLSSGMARFNESFLMKRRPRPFYPLFAWPEVNAKIHEGKAAMLDRCIARDRMPEEAARVLPVHEENGEGDEEMVLRLFSPTR
jgi:arginine/lysine/ornithine decarboxylase